MAPEFRSHDESQPIVKGLTSKSGGLLSKTSLTTHFPASALARTFHRTDSAPATLAVSRSCRIVEAVPRSRREARLHQETDDEIRGETVAAPPIHDSSAASPASTSRRRKCVKVRAEERLAVSLATRRTLLVRPYAYLLQ